MKRFWIFLAALEACLTLFAAPAAAADLSELETVRARYTEWVLGGREEVYQEPFAKNRLARAVDGARRLVAKLKTFPFDAANPPLYDTTRAGADEAEVRFLVADVLPTLAVAYRLEGSAARPNPYRNDPEVKRLLLAAFDRLHARGFRSPMHFPWKAAQVAKRDPAQAIIVDFNLRTSGFALATFLMGDDLRESGRLKRSLATCWEIESHGEKTGDLRALYLQADGLRVVLNLSLPAALAEGNVARLERLKAQLDRSFAYESNTNDIVKSDGLGHHHHGVYPAGYAAYALSEGAFAAWLLRGTSFACSPDTVGRIAHGLATLRVVSQKYDMHPALGGRFNSAVVLPDVLLGYAYLADMEHLRRREFQGMLARLADDAFLESPLAQRPFVGHRNEVPPGPGAVAGFFRILQAANAVGAESDPQGFWALNYGPLAVHRREDWMVAVKGHSRYWWAFERSLADARLDPRRENVLGFHDGSFRVHVHSQRKPWVSARDGGASLAGWDWSRIPGATTRCITPAELLAMDEGGRAYNRPYSDATFVGGVSLEGKFGLFAMDYAEAAPDRRAKPLRALKSAFFFEDFVVFLASGIRDGDGVHPVATTLFQTALVDASQTTYAQGRPVEGLREEETVFEHGPTRLVDAAGDGYFVPAGARVVSTRKTQHSLDPSATKPTKGAFATAWIDHGASPENAACEYVLLVRSGAERLEEFASRSEQQYRVLRCDESAHVVTRPRLGLTGYAVAKGGAPIGDSFLDRTSAPALVMLRRVSQREVILAVCNPDFGWTKGVQYLNRNPPDETVLMQPVPTPVTLEIVGRWKLQGAAEGFDVQPLDVARTRVVVPCSDARSVEFRLERAE